MNEKKGIFTVPFLFSKCVEIASLIIGGECYVFK